METETLSMEWDAESLEEIRRTARVFNMTVTEFFKESAETKLAELKSSPFYRLTQNIEDASEEETEEILKEISGLSDDGLAVSSSTFITV